MIECYTDEKLLELRQPCISAIKTSIKNLKKDKPRSWSVLNLHNFFFNNDQEISLFFIAYGKFALRVISDGTVGVSSIENSLGLKEYLKHINKPMLPYSSYLPHSAKTWEHLLELTQDLQTHLIWVPYKSWHYTVSQYMTNIAKTL